jgi:hypothetical protein
MSWKKIDGANVRVISSNGYKTFCITNDNSVYERLLGEWKQCSGLKLLRISVGYDNTVVGIDEHKHLVEVSGNSHKSYKLEVFHDRQSGIDVACHSKMFVVGIIENQHIFKGSTAGFFEEVGGLLVNITVGVDKVLWGCNRDKCIYRMEPGKNWEQLNGRAIQISAYDREHAVHIGTPEQTLWRRKGHKEEEKMCNETFNWIDVGADIIYACDRNGDVFVKVP